MTASTPPPDFRDPDFRDESGWKHLISVRLRAYWPTLPDEFKAEVAAFAQQAHDASSDADTSRPQDLAGVPTSDRKRS